MAPSVYVRCTTKCRRRSVISPRAGSVDEEDSGKVAFGEGEEGFRLVSAGV